MKPSEFDDHVNRLRAIHESEVDSLREELESKSDEDLCEGVILGMMVALDDTRKARNQIIELIRTAMKLREKNARGMSDITTSEVEEAWDSFYKSLDDIKFYWEKINADS